MPTINSNDLQINQPVEGDASDTSLVITVDPNKPMAVGSYTFQLEVVDNADNRSVPATVTITVLDDQAPTAIIDAPKTVGIGKAFTLNGKNSVDIGGTIVKYIWTQIQ